MIALCAGAHGQITPRASPGSAADVRAFPAHAGNKPCGITLLLWLLSSLLAGPGRWVCWKTCLLGWSVVLAGPGARGVVRGRGRGGGSVGGGGGGGVGGGGAAVG